MKRCVAAMLVWSLSANAAAALGGSTTAYHQESSNNNDSAVPKTGTARKLIPSAPTKPAQAAVTPPVSKSVSAQTPPERAAAQPRVRPAAPVEGIAPSALDAEPVVLESLGVRFQPPKGAILTKPVTGAMPIYTLNDAQDPTRFHIQIQTLVSSLAEPSPSAQISEYLESTKKQTEKVTVLLNEPWLHPKVGGHLLWTSTDLGSGIIAVQGWLVLQTGPYDFLAFSVLVPGAEFEAIRPILEASFRTVHLGDLEQMAAARVARLRRGNELIQAITPEKLRAICTTPPRLYRVWQSTAGTREVEIGYYRVTVQAGTMADASGASEPIPTENPTGVLVRLQGRTIIDAASARFADTDARFWSAWDRGSEAWTSRVTERGGKLSERSFAQTGLRSPIGVGNPRQVLTVINGNAQSRTRDEQEWVVPSGIYLSQTEALLLGELLPREPGQASLNFSYYAFDPQSMRMPQRVETWTHLADDQWMLVTQPGLDETAEISWHDANGRRVRRSEPDGIATELCLPRQLQQIWAEKGLSTK